MNTLHKYEKYKAKYLQSKYILHGGKKDIQFILFGDVMTGDKCWFYDLNNNKINFIDLLEKLGDVIILKPNYVNFMRYSKLASSNTDVNRLFAPQTGPIEFTIEDLQFENYAEWAYNQINPNKEYIAIGLDQGSHFAKYFVNKYHQKCIALFILTDRIFTKQNYEKAFHSQTNYDLLQSNFGSQWEKYKIENATNEIIGELLKTIQQQEGEEDNEKYINLLNSICKGIIRSQYDKVKNMKVKTIIYSDVQSATPEKIESNAEFSKNSDDKVIYYYVLYDSYYLFYGKYCDEIYERIIGMINAK
jgi:hypothetical protein